MRRFLAKVLRHEIAGSGQSAVEFAIVVPVFVIMVLGIFQAVMVYKTYLAVNQAASDAAHVLAAQSTQGDQYANGAYQDADAQGLAAIRAALAGDGWGNIISVDVVNMTGGVMNTVSVTGSDTLINPPLAGAQTVSLDNNYTVTPPASGQTNCQVDQFWLTNALAPATVSSNPYWEPCSPPWNGTAWSSATNQNGRHDMRCFEDVIAVTVKYRYTDSMFPVRWGLTLTGNASTTIEPRAFIGNAGTQNQLGACGSGG
jgi:Flp pilus assembly protein TadG